MCVSMTDVTSSICQAVARGMFTNPTKKGGYGTPNTTIGGAVQADSIKPESKVRLVSAIETKM
jgi:hypothetical protein